MRQCNFLAPAITLLQANMVTSMISGVTMKDIIDRCRGSWALTSDKHPAIVQFKTLPTHVEIRTEMKKHNWDTAWLCWVSTEGDTMSPPMFEFQSSPIYHHQRFLNPWDIKERQERCDELERSRQELNEQFEAKLTPKQTCTTCARRLPFAKFKVVGAVYPSKHAARVRADICTDCEGVEP